MTWFETAFMVAGYGSLISWVALCVVLFLVKNNELRRLCLLVVLLVNGVMGGLLIFSHIDKPTETTEVLTGDLWDIETVLRAELDVSDRVWKRELLTEISTNLNTYRSAKTLPSVEMQTLESFSPEKLHEILEQNPEAITLLDVREEYEFGGFSLKGSQSFRYGDVANDLLPIIDPNKKVVVICFSGIRGFVAANILRMHGFRNVAFIRGGLGAWSEDGLPLEGDIDNFEFLSQRYARLNKTTLEKNPGLKIDFRSNAALSSFTFPNTKIFYGELATTQQTDDFIVGLHRQPVMLLCQSESECYDARMFSYLYEQAGGHILGYHELR